MARVHTHYANLKVARDAPIEVIKAAYKSLSLKYHPDKHPGSEKYARIMRIINTSYEVLSDPVSRRQHDQWIASQEIDSPPPPQPAKEKSNTGTEKQSDPPPPAAPESIQSGWSLKEGWQTWVGWSFVFIVFLVKAIPWDKPATVTQNQSAAPSAAPLEFPRLQEPPPVIAAPSAPLIGRLLYIRPQLGPNGQPWPAASGYLAGFEEFNMNGASMLTVDNRQNDSDMLAKLYYRVGPRPTAVRVLFLKAKDWIRMETIAPGPYDLRCTLRG